MQAHAQANSEMSHATTGDPLDCSIRMRMRVFYFIFQTSETGISAAIPAIAEYFVKLFCGIISDRIHCIPGVYKLRGFNSLGLYGAAVFFTVLAFLDTNTMQVCLYHPRRLCNLPYPRPKETYVRMLAFQTACMAMLMVATGILGCTAAGFFKSAQLISQQYSYIVTGAFSFVLTGTMLIVPMLVGGVAPENQPLQWRWVFIITACVLVREYALFGDIV